MRVVLLNDVGFQGGAGVALHRQVQSFLLGGHAVAVVCWLAGDNLAEPQIVGVEPAGAWEGVHALPEIHEDRGLDEDQIIAAVTAKVLELTPDVVITGNLHFARWPLNILPALQRSGCLVVAYLHDCHWITGRCAYTGGCTLYRTGCDERCPTPEMYPALAPARIGPAWQLRRRVFTGAGRIPIATNSRWLRDVAEEGFAGMAMTDVVHLGLDDRLFSPIDRGLARRLLGLPEDDVVVLVGAVHINEPRKGGALLRKVLRTLASRPGVKVMAFGYQSDEIESVHGLGVVTDERVMPFVFSAADLFLSTSTEEAFGQSILEASACAVPVVALQIGGVPEVARHGQSAVLVPELTAEAVIDVLDPLLRNRARRADLGRNGRRMVEAEFSLEAQLRRWQDYLGRLGNVGAAPAASVPAPGRT
jgi:glycosyltransferase involved in cell wall biosynthesis